MPSSQRSKGIFSIPNLITITRTVWGMGLAFSLISRSDEMFWTFLVLVVLSDGLDGFLARRLKEVSDTGKILDHTIDKIITITIAFLLTLFYSFPLWISLALLLREIITSVIAMFIKFKTNRFPSSTVFGRLFGFSAVVLLILFYYDSPFKYFGIIISLILFVISSFVNLISALKSYE